MSSRFEVRATETNSLVVFHLVKTRWLRIDSEQGQGPTKGTPYCGTLVTFTREVYRVSTSTLRRNSKAHSPQTLTVSFGAENLSDFSCLTRCDHTVSDLSDKHALRVNLTRHTQPKHTHRTHLSHMSLSSAEGPPKGSGDVFSSSLDPHTHTLF